MKSLILKTIAGTIPAIALCILAFMAGSVLHLMDNMTTSDTARALMQQTDFQSKAPEIPDTLPNDFYMLLLGVDSSEQRENGEEAQFYNGSFRSDTIIVAHVNLDEKKVALCSLERDIKTIIDGFEDDGYYKLNAAYALGGVDLMRLEAEQLTGVQIPYYAIVDMDGLTEIIDSFGGIEVDVERDFWDEQLMDGIQQGGVQVLNGQQAVLYSRSRYAWDEGDFARARHQRDVLKALANKIMSGSDNLFELYGAAETISTRVATNFTFPEIFEIAAKMRGMDTSSNIYSMMTPTIGVYEDGVSYQEMDEAAWTEMLNQFYNLIDPNAPTPEELAAQAAAAGDPRYIDEDNDGFYDADANLDGIVEDSEYEAYLAEHPQQPAQSDPNPVESGESTSAQ